MYRHPTDLLSLLGGIVLGGAAVVTILDTDIPWTTTRWIGPVVLILIGLAMLFPASRRLSTSPPKPTETGLDGQPLPPGAIEDAKAELPPSLTD